MGLLKSISTRDTSIENIDDASAALKQAIGFSEGVSINADNATSIPAVLAAVRVISETLASLPLDLFRRRDDGGKEKATNRPLYNTLKFEPNPEMSSLEFRETMQAWLLLWGNAYANIERSGNQVITNLWPITPKRVRVDRNDAGKLIYIVNIPNSGRKTVKPRNMLHIKGLSKNGVVGLSPIQETRQALELAKSMEKHADSTFRNGAQPSAIVSHPNTLQDETRQHLEKQLNNAYSGLENAGRIALLEEGMEWETIEMSSEDIQMIEERDFQLGEIARIFRIQPHLIGDLSDATFSNIETQTLEFVKYTLRPWLVRWEHAIRNQLISEASRGDLFAEHNVDGLLRGDAETRSEFYNVGIQNGFFSINDVRDKENMNPIDGGDIHLVPKNMVPLDDASDLAQAEMQDDQDERSITAEDLEELGYERKQTRQDEDIHKQASIDRQKIAVGFRPVFKDAAGRIVRREVTEVNQLIDKHLPQQDVQAFAEDLEQLYFEEESGEDSLQFFFKQQLRPHFDTLGQQIMRIHEDEHEEDIDVTVDELVDELIDNRSLKYAGLSVDAMMKDVKEATDITETRQQDQSPEEAAREEIERRGENRPETISKSETHQVESFITRQVFLDVGVTRLIWTTVGENCPICNELSGTVVGTEEAFIGQGEAGPEGFIPNKDVIRPPLHRGCDCVLTRI